MVKASFFYIMESLLYFRMLQERERTHIPGIVTNGTGSDGLYLRKEDFYLFFGRSI
jgi:hypothetical protein